MRAIVLAAEHGLTLGNFPRKLTAMPSRAKLSEFVAWSGKNSTSDEKGQAQIFLDRLFQAFGQPGCLDVGGVTELGVKLVEWLNARKDVQEVLAEQFGERPVSEQNLSEWKAGGFQDWLRHEESRAFVENLTEQAGELDDTADGAEISDRFASILAAEMTRLATLLLEKETDPEKRWQQLREIHRELSQLRRDDHRAVRTLIKRDRWTRETEREDEENDKRLEKEHLQKMCAPFWARLQLGSMAELFGGGELGRDIASFILECQNGLRPGTLSGRKPAAESGPAPASPNPTESNPVRPNQTESK